MLNSLNSCRAELFQLYFSIFEAGIANAISSFKWQKIWLFMKNKHVWKVTFWLTEHLSQTILWISVSFYFLWNLLEIGYIRIQQHKGENTAISTPFHSLCIFAAITTLTIVHVLQNCLFLFFISWSYAISSFTLNYTVLKLNYFIYRVFSQNIFINFCDLLFG